MGKLWRRESPLSPKLERKIVSAMEIPTAMDAFIARK